MTVEARAIVIVVKALILEGILCSVIGGHVLVCH
jgi:hypothetical protein